MGPRTPRQHFGDRPAACGLAHVVAMAIRKIETDSGAGSSKLNMDVSAAEAKTWAKKIVNNQQ